MREQDASLLVSGWRHIAHSYALVAQSACLELLRRLPERKLFFEDVPYHSALWKPRGGIYAAPAEAALRAIPPLPEGREVDAEIRYGYPCDLLRPKRAGRTLVFSTSEFLTVPALQVAQGVDIREAQRRHNYSILTCSNWSKAGFVRAGVPHSRIEVVPLGFDPALFRPATEAQRAQVRADSGVAAEDFVFLNVSAMSPNKGLGFLLRAFAGVLRVRPQVRLVLKGMDSLYTSSAFVDQQMNALEPALVSLVASRLSYVGDGLTFAEMAGVYQAADCYVSPYVAEGFNLPVLEAAASGLPVICTAGGSTDDFTTKDFALRIDSKLRPVVEKDYPDAMGLLPNHEHLVELMLKAVDDAAFRRAARIAGPAHVGARYTWEKMVDGLMPLLLGAQR